MAFTLIPLSASSIATDFVNPADLKNQTIQEKLIEMTDGGCDYTFDCTGNVGVMRAARIACVVARA